MSTASTARPARRRWSTSTTRELERGFDAYFSIGTSGLFPYISQPIVEAARRGRLTVEINPGQTDLSELVEHRFACSAGRALPALFDGQAREAKIAAKNRRP